MRLEGGGGGGRGRGGRAEFGRREPGSGAVSGAGGGRRPAQRLEKRQGAEKAGADVGRGVRAA